MSRVLCKVTDLGTTGCKEFRLGQGEWPMRGFVVQTSEGIRAYVNRCAHLAYPLNYLEDFFFSHDGRYIECFVHGALFEKHSGFCIAGPCMGLSLAKIPIVIEAGDVALAPDIDGDALAERYA